MYKTVLSAGECEIVIEKSKFIAHVFPINREDEAQKYIEQIKKKHWQAAHNVPIFVLGEKYHVQRYSDDGEPSGTAGVPVLEMLKKEGITNLCLVITRYFGGVKLGTGGLVRAYTEAAKSVLNQVGVVTVDYYEHLQCQFEYTFQGKLLHALASMDAYAIQTNYSDVIELDFYVPCAQGDHVYQEFVNLTSNQIKFVNREVIYGTLNNEEFVCLSESN
jgi:uncharacterized YigZ family protein